MAPQHRRGGKHAVKDEDLTHTKYDDYSREQLLAAVKEAGCYVKDDKKSVMARKLAEHDQNVQNKERRAMRERKEKEETRQQEIKDAAKARKSRRRARAGRNEERGLRREHGEDVSSNSDDTDDEQNRCDAHKLTVTGGEALSDGSWEDTCSETTIRSNNPPVCPSCRLRLFEWPYPSLPSNGLSSDLRPEQFPAALAYAPLKLVTSNTHEKVTLPGQRYPAGVDPNFVPILDPLTRSAARHGHMIGLLAHATIEPATLWVGRTTVQGWNGRMYLSLPAHHDAKDIQLDAVYCKWHVENSKLLQPTPGVTAVKADRKRRFAQRLANKRKAVSEVYEASRWKPLALGYMPAYLDWEAGLQCAGPRYLSQTIHNLFYVRFPGCDVPHYYFWTEEGEWSDPSIPDTYWSPGMSERQGTLDIAPNACKASPPTKFRIKKLTTPPFGQSKTENFEPTLLSVEYDLIRFGLSATLAKNRALTISAGDGQAWIAFTSQLPYTYPSGELPRAPPAETEKGLCAAQNITARLSGHEVPPLSGEESWTRNDDDFWDVVDDADGEVFVEDADGDGKSQDLRTASADEEEAKALYRRDSMDIPPSLADRRIWAWLDNIESMYSPRLEPLSPFHGPIGSPEDEPISPLDLTSTNTNPTCPFCNAPWYHLPSWEQAAHMLSHSHISSHPKQSTSRINAIGSGMKRRHSLLSHRTLQSYHVNYGNGKKMLRVDSAASLAEGWAKVGREASPFTRETRRAKNMAIGEGRGGSVWMLERRVSAVWEMVSDDGEWFVVAEDEVLQ